MVRTCFFAYSYRKLEIIIKIFIRSRKNKSFAFGMRINVTQILIFKLFYYFKLMAADQPKDSEEALFPTDSIEEIKEEASVEKSDKSIESLESHEHELKNRQRRQVDDAGKIPEDKTKIQETLTADDNTSESFSNESSEEKKDKLLTPENQQQQATNRQ